LKIVGASSPKMDEWKRLVEVCKKKYDNPKKTLNVALCGKYMQLEDSYASIREALIHAAANLNVACKLKMLDTEFLNKPEGMEVLEYVKEQLADVDAVIVPGGFGSRGMEGKISVIQVVREMNIPFLGICYGMQLAVVEYARHKCGMPLANTAEVESEGIEVKEPVIAFLPGLEYVKVLGGTLRKGGYDVFLKKNSLAEKIYNGASVIRERFRHRYEVNPLYISKLEENGLTFSGYSAKEGNIMQVMEISEHPFFVGCQFHPELTSTLLKPSPLFYNLLKAGEVRCNERG